MPVGEGAGEALGSVARFIGRVVFELIFEVLIQGVGHMALKTVRPGRTPGELESAVVGLALWAAVIGGGFWLLRGASA